MSVVTVAQLRAYLNQVKSGTSTDELLLDIVARADSIVGGALGFVFLDADATWTDVAATQKVVKAERSQYLKLPPYQYGSITSIAAASGTGSSLSVSAGSITNYDETRSKFYLYRDSGWEGRYAVTAKYGYGPAPESIVELVLELAANIWRQKDQGLWQTTMGVDPVGQGQQGSGALKYVGGLNAQQKMIVANVRRAYIDTVH